MFGGVLALKRAGAVNPAIDVLYAEFNNPSTSLTRRSGLKDQILAAMYGSTTVTFRILQYEIDKATSNANVARRSIIVINDHEAASLNESPIERQARVITTLEGIIDKLRLELTRVA